MVYNEERLSCTKYVPFAVLKIIKFSTEYAYVFVCICILLSFLSRLLRYFAAKTDKLLKTVYFLTIFLKLAFVTHYLFFYKNAYMHFLHMCYGFEIFASKIFYNFKKLFVLYTYTVQLYSAVD